MSNSAHSADEPDHSDTQSRGAPVSQPDATGTYHTGTTHTSPPGEPSDALTATAPVQSAGAVPEVPGFEVLRSVGRGGMGSVFEAIQLGTRRRVALKLLLTGWPVDPVACARFKREAEILAAIDHPHVVTVYHAGVWHGQQFLVMKFVPGGTLAEHLPALRSDRRAACRLLATVARAVGHLHAHGFVHRDLKPTNVLVGADGVPVVADLGLARSVADETVHPITQPSGVLGTRPYMSPEQTRGGADSFPPACDIWALGVILYELLAGARPFARDEPSELFHSIRTDPTPSMSPKLGVPPELEAIARRCLAKCPADRYPTAEALADDLEAWAAERPLSALAVPEPAPEPERVPAPAPPHSRGSVAAVVALAALLATAAGALFALGGRAPVPDPRPLFEQAPLPHPAPTLAERLVRGDEVELIGPKGELRVPAEPALPGSALATGRNGFPTLGGRATHAATFVIEPLPFPFELAGEVAVLNGLPGTGHAGFAVGTQTASLNGEPNLVLWGFGARSEPDRFVGDEIESTDRGYGVLRIVRAADKLHSDLNFTCPEEAKLRHPAKEPGPLFWHPIRVRVRPDQLAATFRGAPIGPPHIAPAKSLSALHTATGLPRSVPVAVGPGLGLYSYEAEGLFRNVRLRRAQ